MDCSPLAMAFKDQDMKLIPLPPPGTEYERLPSPPPSDHSSREDQDDKEQDDGNKKKKIQLTSGVYLKIRNENVVKYLNKLREQPSSTYEAELAKFRNRRQDSWRFVKGNAVKKEVVKKEVDGEFGYSSESSRETDFAFPRNIARARQHDFQVECYQSMVDQRKQQENGNGVLFSHINFQLILEVKWLLVKLKRLEQILEGVELGYTVDPNWIDFENEVQMCYGPMDIDSLHFRKLVEVFQIHRWERIVEMFEEERKMMKKMVKEKRVPSEFPQQLAALRETRSRLEMRIMAMSELQCDQNPYSNPENMDFWVMPRPKQTIEVYTIRNEEMDKFLEFNLPLDEKGVPPEQVETEDQNQLLVRKGYNAAVFDVGWHYSPIKSFWDSLRDCFFEVHSGNCSHSLDEKRWKQRLLELRGRLMEFNPFGVEDMIFNRLVHDRRWWLEDTIIFYSLFDENNGRDRLVDLHFRQTLLNNSDPGENKVILFDSLFEGVIVTPAEMLVRVWARIRFLIEEQPNQLLPLEDFQRIYEDSFGQKFFPLQWGFKDVEGFFQSVHQYLPKEIAEDVTIVTKDERELEKIDADAAGVKAKIDAKWASILENDDEDDGDDDNLYGDIFEELIHEGPWLREGEVYRVLDY